ncbi:MAG: hypothetical protein ACOCZK_06260 [Planctomycetota bacterium]
MSAGARPATPRTTAFLTAGLMLIAAACAQDGDAPQKPNATATATATDPCQGELPIVWIEDITLRDGGMTDRDPATGGYRIRINPDYFAGNATLLAFVRRHEEAHCRLGHIEELVPYGWPETPAPGTDAGFDTLRRRQETAADRWAVKRLLAEGRRASVQAAIDYFLSTRQRRWSRWYPAGSDRAHALEQMLAGGSHSAGDNSPTP